MSRKVLFNLVIIIILLAASGGTYAAARYYADLPNRLSQHETILLGQSRLAPGSQGSLRILVRDTAGAAPLANARVRLAMRPSTGGEETQLFEGQTGEDGSLAASFSIPRDVHPNQVLIVETHSKLGADRLERPVQVTRDYRVLLSTDKPVYQPGQLIRFRALALSAFDLAPAAGLPVEITIADGKGNKVFRQALTTSEFGAAWTDFQLASEVNSGDYKISATLGGVTSEKTVAVEHYVLPKFKVDLTTERKYYQPGARVAGTLQADYFFGKPVAGGGVVLEGYTFDVQRNDVFRAEFTTDENGGSALEFDLPGYIAGSELDGGLGRFYLQATVTDATGHSETARLSLPVSQSGLVIQAVPEGGVFRPGVENILYLMASYPDGSPAEASFSVQFYETGQTLSAQAGAYGLAELRYTPNSPYQSFSVQAFDPRGASAQRDFYFEGQWNQETILLRPEKPVYRVGETMKLQLFSNATGPGTVFLDIVRGGQTISTRSVRLDNSRGEAAVDLTPDLYGTLDLHAYKILADGSITRDTRLVIVDPAADLSLEVRPGQEVYRPGDSGSLAIQVRDAGGIGVQAALGVAVVDEAVFALAESDPGFARLYFLLESEILTPRYDLHGLTLPELARPIPSDGDPLLYQAAEGAARASLAEAARSSTGFSLMANSHQDAVQRAQNVQSTFFAGLSRGLLIVCYTIAGAIVLLATIDLLRRKVMGRSLLSAVGGVSFLAVLILIAPLPSGYEWATAPMERLGALVQWLSYAGMPLLVILALTGLAGWLALIGIAIAKRDSWLGWTAGLTPFFLLALLAFAALARSDVLTDAAAITLIIALLAVPVTLFTRAAGLFWERRPLAAVAAFPLAFFLLAGVLPLGSLASSRGAIDAEFDQAMMARDGLMVEMAAPAMAGNAMEEKAVSPVSSTTNGVGSPQAGEPPRLRQYFPETMAWIPDAVTLPDGSLNLDLPIADSITTWRITALASDRAGQLGSLDAPLRVFQDFFVDLDLPVSLTVGDEIAVPVGVFNYLTEPQTVRLELAQEGWFELLDEPVQTLEVDANDIRVAYFRVRALQFGLQGFQVTASGTSLSDAIRKEVRVYPAGKPIQTAASGRILPGQTVVEKVWLPPSAVPGTQGLTVKIYPGVLSQVVEGLDSILRMPFGCFEQTSSTTYPNVLVLDYLRTTNQAAPEAEMKAEEYINLGYQRLTTFEVPGGGFSLFGEAPADRMLTAYGLQEFSDMSRVHNIDPALLRRAADWLASQQSTNGSWENDRGLVHESTWSSLGNDRLPVTAYIAWSLAEAGFGAEDAALRGLNYVREFAAQAEDSYVAALVANALVAGDKAAGKELSAETKAALERLAGMAQREGMYAFWQSGVATFVGGEGKTASIETTALAAFAFLRAGEQPDLANAALGFLVREKDSFGTWHSTQATVLALKALIQSVRAGGEKANAQIIVTLDGGQQKVIQITPQNFDVVQTVRFDDVPFGRESRIDLRAEGEGNLMYQVVSGYYQPWDKLAELPAGPDGSDLVSINVAYDRSELAVDDTVGVGVRVALNQPGARAEQAMIDLGLPPGFSLVTEDLDGVVARYNDVLPDYAGPKVQRYELTGRQILVYVTNLNAEIPLEFSFRLRAKYPLRVQAPASSAYDYYNPDKRADAAPVILEVQ
jgi:hypothetical protein